MSLKGIFVSKYLQTISFSFSIKYTNKKMLEDLFLGVHTIQTVLKHGWMPNSTKTWLDAAFNVDYIQFLSLTFIHFKLA